MTPDEMPPEAKQLLAYLESAKKQREDSRKRVDGIILRMKILLFLSNVLPLLLLVGLIAFLATHDFQPSVVDSRADYFESLKGGE